MGDDRAAAQQGPFPPQQDSATPGTVAAARILLWIQAWSAALAVVLGGGAAFALVAIAQVFEGPLVGFEVLLVMFYALLVVLVGTLVVTGLAVAIPSFVLAVRFRTRRSGVHTGALVLEILVFLLCVVAAAGGVVVMGSPMWGAVCVLAGALPGATFGLLLTPQAKAHFQADARC